MSVPYNTSLFYNNHLGTIKVSPNQIKLPIQIPMSAPKRGRPRKIPDMEAPVIKRRRRRWSKDSSQPDSIAFRTRMGTSIVKRASLRLKFKGPIPPPPIDNFKRTVELTSDIKMGDPACKELFLSALGLYPKHYLNGVLVIKPPVLPLPKRNFSPRRPPLPPPSPQSSASSTSSTILAPLKVRKASNPPEIEKSLEFQPKLKASESSVEAPKIGSTPFTNLQRILWETYSEEVVVVEDPGSKEDNFKLNGEKFPFLTSLLADGNNDFDGENDDDIIIERVVLNGKTILDTRPPKNPLESNFSQKKKSIRHTSGRVRVLSQVLIPDVDIPEEYRPPTPDSDATTEFEESEDSGMEA